MSSSQLRFKRKHFQGKPRATVLGHKGFHMKIFDRISNSLELRENKKVSSLLAILTSIFIAAFVVSNIVAAKSVLLFDWTVAGAPLSIASSFLVFPITYIISDIFSEVYGYAWSRKISWIAFFVNLIMVGLIFLTTLLPGTSQEFDEAYSTVLSSSFGIVLASQFAFLIGDLLNDLIFRSMKRRDRRRNNFSFLKRSITSSLAGEILDSLVFLPLLYLAIGGFGNIITSFPQFIAIVCFQGFLKTAVEIVGAPLEITIVNWVKRVENMGETKSLDKEANGR